MHHDLRAIQANFEQVQQMRISLRHVLEDMQGFIVTLHKVYGDLLKTHDVKSYTLGLDSLHFQHRVMEMDYESLQRSLTAVENRMYCEYFKLYKMLQAYVGQDLKDSLCHMSDKIKRNFPVYKDLEPLKAYNFALTVEIQQTIVVVVQELSAYYGVLEADVDKDEAHAERGLNVDNMVTAHRFSNQLLNERIHLFMRYMNVFHKQHQQYFHHLLAKSRIMLQLMNSDIHFHPSGTVTTGGNSSSGGTPYDTSNPQAPPLSSGPSAGPSPGPTPNVSSSESSKLEQVFMAATTTTTPTTMAPESSAVTPRDVQAWALETMQANNVQFVYNPIVPPPPADDRSSAPDATIYRL